MGGYQGMSHWQYVIQCIRFYGGYLEEPENISFSGDGASDQNWALECYVKTVFSMARTMLIHDVLRYTGDTFSTDIWPMEMEYDLWIYNWIPDMTGFISKCTLLYALSLLGGTTKRTHNCLNPKFKYFFFEYPSTQR